MIEAEILLLCDKYKFLSTLHIHISRSKDWATFSLVKCLAMYKESLRAGL